MCQLLAGLELSADKYSSWSCVDNVPMSSICTWTGVLCSSSYVTAIMLTDQSIGGTISDALLYLSHLKFLDISSTGISGLTDIANLIPPSLEYLIVESDLLKSSTVDLGSTNVLAVDTSSLSSATSEAFQ